MKPMPWNDDRLAANGRAVRENFAEWFGQSKVLNEDGAPLVLFHGRGVDFSRFQDIHGRNGFYFTPCHGYAELFAEGEAPNVLAVYLSISRPADLRDEIPLDIVKTLNAADFGRTGDLMFSHPQARWEFLDGCTALREILEAAGYDGIRLTEPQPDGSSPAPSSWVAFHPEQIKSALGNSGLYLAGSPSLDDQEAARQLELATQARSSISSATQIREVRL